MAHLGQGKQLCLGWEVRGTAITRRFDRA